ncbi:MAG TPA: hypothetical protein VFS33_05760 [Gemmatimonadales bacterium]|nr:hypothetical protein [Gemmatimonadales bacterium]
MPAYRTHPSTIPLAALPALLLLDALVEGGPLLITPACAGLEIILGLPRVQANVILLWWLDHHDKSLRDRRAELVGGREIRDALFDFDRSDPRWQAFYPEATD